MRRLIELAALDQLQAVIVELGEPGAAPDSHVGVVRIEDEVFAFRPTCSHRPAPLTEGAVTWKRTLLCPWHLGTYNLRTGDRMSGPPERGIPTWPVRIVDGIVWLDADAGEPGPAPTYPDHPFDGGDD